MQKYKKANEHPQYANFRFLIEKNRLTITEFSKILGCSKNAIYSYFKWDRKNQINKMLKKLHFFN